jgi:hypothetical protein
MSTRQDEQVRIYLEYTHTYTINWTELHRWAPPDWIWENASCDLLLPQNDHFLFHQLQLKQFQIGNSPIVLFISFLSPGRRNWIFFSVQQNNMTLMCLENLRLFFLMNQIFVFCPNSKIRFCMSSTKSWSPFWHLLVIRNSPIPTLPVSWKEPEVSIWDPIKSGDFFK